MALRSLMQNAVRKYSTNLLLCSLLDSDWVRREGGCLGAAEQRQVGIYGFRNTASLQYDLADKR